MRRYILLILLVTSSAAQAAWRAPVTNFLAENSEAGRQNWKIAYNSNGWIYFANNSGLLEYNGYSWSVRPLENLSTVRSVACDSNGDIYVGGSGELGRFRADEMGRLTYTNLNDKMENEMRSFKEVWNILTVKDHVYFQLRRDIYILNHHEEFRRVQSNGIILSSCIINNSLYFATTNGLYVMGDSEPISVNLSQQIPFKDICTIAPYGTGKILIATISDGLFIYDNGKIKKFETDGDKLLSSNQIFSMVISDKHIACGTVKGGVITMNLDGSGAEQNDLKSGLSNNTVLSLLFDQDDNLWCGLDNGIDFIALSSPIRYAEINRDFRFSGYCTLQDEEYIYMGSNQGLIRTKRADKNKTLLRANEQTEIIDNSDGQVWNIQTIDNEMYCCHNRGLFVVEKHASDPYLRPIYTEDGAWNIIPINQNMFLLCTYEGIIRLERNASGDFVYDKIEGYGYSVRDMIFLDPLRMGYFISEQGLVRVIFDPEFTSAKSQILLSSTAFDIKLLTIENQLIAYTPQGIYTINDDGSIQLTNNYDSLFDLGELYSMIEVDPKRNIWYVSGNRLLRRSYDTTIEQFEAHSQVIVSDHNFFLHGFTQIKPLDNKYYILNGVYGFSIVDSEWQPNSKAAIKPRIIGIYDSNNRDSLLLSGAYGVEIPKIELKYSSNSLHIIFGNNTANDSGVQYSYMLKGSDNQWSEWSSINQSNNLGIHNQKEYTQLSEGDYTFNLKLRDSSGNIEQTSLDITILPPWQRTKQMYLLYTLIIISVILYTRSRLNRYYSDRRRLIELQSIRQIESQKRRFESQAIVQENNIIKLKNEKLEGDIIAKSAELNNLLLNKLEKNDLITKVKEDLAKIKSEVVSKQYVNITKRISSLEKHLDDKMIDNVDWNIFEANFNITSNNFTHKLNERYSWMNTNERKLCIYIKMGLQNKEIAPLLNLSVRGVEMLRYRIRKKMELDRNDNLYEHFQRII